MKRPKVTCSICGNEYWLTMKSVVYRYDSETGKAMEMTKCPYCRRWNAYKRPRLKKFTSN